MKTFWVRWESDETPEFQGEPWCRGLWCSGYGQDTDIFVAVVDAMSGAKARKLVKSSTSVHEFSFCEEYEYGWVPGGDRFRGARLLEGDDR